MTTKKKTYMRPSMHVVEMGTLCYTGLKTGSVFKDAVKYKKIDSFDVKEEDETKQWNIWTKDKWGDD